MTPDLIHPDTAHTLAGLFRERVQRTPDSIAYRYFDADSQQWCDLSWRHMGAQVARWQQALAGEALEAGDRIAIMLHNCPEWVMFDQSALGAGLVTVPLYTQDRPDNIAYILKDAGVKLLLIGDQEHWDRLQSVYDQLDGLVRILSWQPVEAERDEPRLKHLDAWVPDTDAAMLQQDSEPDALATLVYTSGTTGRPKGVMLSHRNILWNAYHALELVPAYREDRFLSFLPLSHTLERTAGYYLPIISGSTVAYNRSIPELAEDLVLLQPTIMMSVPRIFERVYNKIYAGLQEKPAIAQSLFRLAVNVGWRKFQHQQGRCPWTPVLWLEPLLHKLVGAKVMAKLGGRMRMAVVGGAPLSESVARLFIGLGLPMLQGYGLTETSPVISVNTLEDNDPASVGVLLADLEVNIGADDELLYRGHGMMLGYWNNPEATQAITDSEGWLHTGDKARLDKGHLYITGRIKEIIVMANGEKVPPADMEMAICTDALFEQVMVLGENRPYLAVLAVLNPEQWAGLAASLGVAADQSEALQAPHIREMLLQRIAERLSTFPGYAQVRAIHCQLEPWTVDDGLITPTLKLRRNRVMATFEQEIDALYEEH